MGVGSLQRPNKKHLLWNFLAPAARGALGAKTPPRPVEAISSPWGIWQYLETFLVIITGKGDDWLTVGRGKGAD